MQINYLSSKPNPKIWEYIKWIPTNEQIEQFIYLQSLLSKWNAEMNLTKLVNGDDYWIGQICDSLWPLEKELNNNKENKYTEYIDVGSGCGFPGLAIAIAIPKSRFTLVDSSKRKTTALKAIVKDLGLNSRIKVLTERIEITGQSITYRGTFDLAMARAVASAPIVAEYLVPLLKPKGNALLFRGKWDPNDNLALKNSLKPLKAKIEQKSSKSLPNNRGIRNVIRLKCDGKCPSKYPRAIGIPNKRPLGI